MIHTVPETGSTNADLLNALGKGEALDEGFWLRAELQTGGRGRRGQTWNSPAGNLYCSTIVRLRPDDHPAPSLSLVAGLAVHDLLRTQLINGQSRPPTEQRWLKWPNDVLIGGAKLAGILCERMADAVVVGIGINVEYAPAVVGRTTTSIHQENGNNANDPARILGYLEPRFAERLSAWRDNHLAATIAAWELRAHEVGDRLSVTDDGNTVRGYFAGLDNAGALLLRLEDGEVRTIHAGDVNLD